MSTSKDVPFSTFCTSSKKSENFYYREIKLDFLRKWFSEDRVANEKLKSCPTIPNTATIQSTFDEILIQNDESNKTITVQSKITGINMRESKSLEWSQTDVFEYSQDNIVLINSRKSELTERKIDLKPDHFANNELR